jgi:tetratricopeptide (TPR) repeat protein
LENSHPGATGLVNAIVNLGTLRERQQRLTEAEDLFRRALDLYATRPELAYANVTASAVARHYAALLRKNGRKADAKIIERQAVSMSKSDAIRGFRQTIDIAEMPIK